MTEYEKLKDIIGQIDTLIEKQVNWQSPEMKAWHIKAMRWVINHFGEKSYEATSFIKIHYYSFHLDEATDIRECINGLIQAKAVLSSYLEELETTEPPEDKSSKYTYSEVFIVHGHDGELKESIARIIEKQGITPIILSEQANQGQTIIEKLENNSIVGGAICLFTADDVGREINETSVNPRSRQNVVFETGYFMGCLGRDHVVIIADLGIEMPSDLFGVVYTNKTNWQIELLRELNNMGYKIDLSKLL